jgi:hypothetical protein
MVRITMQKTSNQIEAIVREFTAQVVAAVEAEVSQRIQDAVAAAFGAAGPSVAKAAPSVAATRKPAKASPAVSATRKLQGQYLGTLRGLAPAARLRVRKVAQEQGVAAALKFARSLK